MRDVLYKLKIEDCDRIIFVIRHAEKKDPPEEDPFKDVELTEKGILRSYHLGKELSEFMGKKNYKVISSPLKRCIQTAESIIVGIGGEKHYPEVSSILGNPGPYVEDENLAGNVFIHNIAIEIIKMQLEHQPLPGFRDVEDGSGLLMGFLLKQCNEKICVAITHDVIILALIGFLQGDVSVIDDWMTFLNGVVFCIEDGKISMYTKNTSCLDITQKLKEIGIP